MWMMLGERPLGGDEGLCVSPMKETGVLIEAPESPGSSAKSPQTDPGEGLPYTLLDLVLTPQPPELWNRAVLLHGSPSLMHVRAVHVCLRLCEGVFPETRQ